MITTIKVVRKKFKVEFNQIKFIKTRKILD